MSNEAGSPVATRRLGASIVTVAFLGAVIGGAGAPLITSVALDLDVPLDATQWTLTLTLFAGAVTAPVLGRLGTGGHRRGTILLTLLLVAFGGLLTAIPTPFLVLLVGLALFLQGSVLQANAAMLTAGVGMYLLFSRLTRPERCAARKARRRDGAFRRCGLLSRHPLIR